MNHLLYDPTRIADVFCKKHPGPLALIEQARLMKGKVLSDWPYWCFLPQSYWIMLFTGKQYASFTRELWRDIEQFQILGTWRYSKGIYSPHPTLLEALIDTPVADSLPVDVFFRLPEWCIYVRTPGMTFFAQEPLYGFWATVSLDDTSHERSLKLLLNTQNGLQFKSLPLLRGPVSEILQTGFYKGLDSSGAAPDVIETLKQSEYLADLLERKARALGRLLSVLLFICSDEPEIDSERQPGTYPIRPKPVKTKKGYRLFPANGVHYWTVGEQTGHMLAESLAHHQVEDSAHGRHPRAHLRRGHWHGFWSGKKDDPDVRTFSYHWLPPQIVGGRRT